MKIKVSIVIPIYNVEKYLRQCLDSVVNQTLKELEIICVDDGSTDNSGKICDEYALKDKRIKVIHKENGGYGKAMNVGFDNARGEYIGIVEPDDYILNNMYEKLYSFCVNNNLDFIKSDFCEVNGENKKILKFDETNELYYKVINPSEHIDILKNHGTNWCGIYKNDFIKKFHIKHNETPGASYQDNGFWFLTNMYALRTMFIPDVFYMYRIDNPNSSIQNKEKVFCIKTEYDYIRDILENNPNLKENFLSIYQYRKFLNYVFTFRRIHIKLKKDFLKVFKKEFKQAYQNKEIDKTLFSKKDLIKFYMVIKCPIIYYYIYLIRQKFFTKTN